MGNPVHVARIPLPAPLSHSPFTTRQGEDAGLSLKRMHGRDLQSPFRGVRTPTVGPLTFQDRCQTYRQKMPAHAYFCGPTSARIMGVPLPLRLEQSPVLHVAVPPGFRAPTGRNIRGHTLTTRPRDLRIWNGLPISGPESTWCTLGAVLNLAELVAAGDFLIHHALPLTTTAAIAEALNAFVGRRGLKTLRAALPLLNNRSESPQESNLRVIVVRSGIEGVVANFEIRTTGGYDYRGDLAIPARKFIVEYQSRFHDKTKEFRSDMTRISRLEADGWFVMQVNKDDLGNPSELLQRIGTVLQTRPRMP